MDVTESTALATATEIASILCHGGINAMAIPAYRGNAMIVSEGDRAVWVGVNDTDVILSACTTKEVFTGPQATFRATPAGVMAAVVTAYLA